MNQDQRLFAASALWLLKGDAAQRAITSWHYGWKNAQTTSGTSWMPALLTSLLNDNYGVIRQITTRSLRSLNNQWVMGYDFLAPPQEREAQAKQIRAQLPPANAISAEHRNSRVLRNSDGSLKDDVLTRLLREQDRRSVTIQE